MVSYPQILEVLRREPHLWGVGYQDSQQRHQYYLAAADSIEHLLKQIQTLELQLSKAKTAALVEVAKQAAAADDWKSAQLILGYLDSFNQDYPVLDKDSIIEP